MSLDYPPQVRRPPFRRAYRLPFRSPAGVETIIAQALADIDSDNLVGIASVSEIPNSGLGGAGFDYDTVIGTPANGKPHLSGSALLFGAIGDYLSTPDSAAVSVPGSIDIRIRLSPDDWTPAANGIVLSKYVVAGNQKSFFARLDSDGTLLFLTSVDGSASVASSSTAATGFTNGTLHWTRFTWNDTSDKSNFYTSNDDTDDDTLVSWTSLGDENVSHVSAGIFDSTAGLEVGAQSAGINNRFIGNIRRAVLYNGINGTVVADMNPADQTNASDGTFTSSTTGEVWTLNGNTFVQNTGHKALNSIGGYGLETTAGQDIAVFTRLIVGRFLDSSPAADQVIFDARSNALKSVSLFSDFSNSNKLTLDAGGTPIAIGGAYDNDLHVFTVISNGANSLLRVSGVGEITGNPGSEVLDYGTILAALGSGSSAPFSYSRDITFNAAISGARIAQIEDALAQKYKGVAV